MGPFVDAAIVYFNGSLYDSSGGGAYSPPPPPKNHPNLLLQSKYKIKLQNGSYLALQGYE